jgi:hypothetical protein
MYYKSTDNQHFFKKRGEEWLHVNVRGTCLNVTDGLTSRVLTDLLNKVNGEYNGFRRLSKEYVPCEQYEFDWALNNTLKRLNINNLNFKFNAEK